jgi:hypothetical protein
MDEMYLMLSEKDALIANMEQRLVNAKYTISELMDTIDVLVSSKWGRIHRPLHVDFIDNLNLNRSNITLSRIDELIGSESKPLSVIVILLMDLLTVSVTSELSYFLLEPDIMMFMHDGHMVGRSIGNVGRMIFDIIQSTIVQLHGEFYDHDTKNVNGVVSVLNSLKDKELIITQFTKVIRRNKLRIT